MNALSCIDHVLDSLDKMTILDEVLPLFTESQCQDAAIVMTIVGMYYVYTCLSFLLLCL